MFLANYSDGLSDLPLDQHIADFRSKDVTASFAAVRSWQTFHTVQSGEDGFVTGIGEAGNGDYLINGGFFVLRQEIFDDIREGEELVEQPFRRLIDKRKLGVFRYRGFWQSMDTFKDKITLDRMEARGDCPWMVWKRPRRRDEGELAMQALGGLLGSASRLRVLCIGAHCDDIEIGCGATLLRLAGERELDVSWLVLCSTPAACR